MITIIYYKDDQVKKCITLFYDFEDDDVTHYHNRTRILYLLLIIFA